MLPSKDDDLLFNSQLAVLFNQVINLILNHSTGVFLIVHRVAQPAKCIIVFSIGTFTLSGSISGCRPTISGHLHLRNALHSKSLLSRS